ncbi:MAG: MFS transporter [Candidatus Thorarchaeota archaeon]
MTDELASSSGSSYRWVILTLTWLVYFEFGLVLSSLPPLVTPIATELSLTYSQMGVILGTVILMYIPLSIPIGFLIDRIGQKRMITFGVLLISSSEFLRFFAVGFETLFLTVLLFGVGGPTISVGLAKVIASWFSGRERGIASGVYMTGALIGSALVLAITNILVIPVVGTWRNAFAIYGAFGFLIAFIWLLMGKEREESVADDWSADQLKDATRRLLGEKSVWLVAIVGISYFFVTYGLGNWLPTLLESKGMNPVDAGLFASLPVWCGIAGSAILPGIVGVGSRAKLTFVVILLSGLTTMLIGVSSGPILVVSLVLFGFFAYAILPILLVILMDMPGVGSDYIGVASGILFSVGATSGFLAPIIAGYVADLMGSLIPSMILVGLVVEVTLLFTWTLRDH